VAHSGDADSQTPPHELADHASTGEGLSRPGRSLNRKDRLVEVGTDACRKLDDSLALSGLEDAFSKSWRPAQKKLGARLVLRSSRHPVLNNVPGDAQ
jgi:hypothetical protein